MCGCNSGGGGSSSLSKSSNKQASVLIAEPCTYTLEQVENWLILVKCYKDKELYLNTKITKKLLNTYISRLEAAKHYSNNICFFEKKLKEIENFITVIIATGQCQI